MGAQAVRLSNVDINNALENKDFEVLFQPIFDLGNGALARMETFVRWRHPTLGVLPPGAFISFFESQGRMSELTRYILSAALDNYGEWRGPYAPGFSVNLSLADLADDAFADHLTSVLKEEDFPADLITLECPMPPVDSDLEGMIDKFAQLRDTGARLAIEVRGRASEFLRTIDPFPFDEIKTGGSSILRFARTVRGPGLSAISDLLDIAKRANAVTTAVGVEDQASLSALRGLGFTAAQGNHLAKVGVLADFRPAQVNHVREMLELPTLSGDDLSALFRTSAPKPHAATSSESKATPSVADAEQAAPGDAPADDTTELTQADADKQALVARARKKAKALALAKRAKARDARKAAAIKRAKAKVARAKEAPDEQGVIDVDTEDPRELQDRIAQEFGGSPAAPPDPAATMDIDFDAAAAEPPSEGNAPAMTDPDENREPDPNADNQPDADADKPADVAEVSAPPETAATGDAHPPEQFALKMPVGAAPVYFRPGMSVQGALRSYGREAENPTPPHPDNTSAEAPGADTSSPDIAFADYTEEAAAPAQATSQAAQHSADQQQDARATEQPFDSGIDAIGSAETSVTAPRKRRKNFLTRKYKVVPNHFWPKPWRRALQRRGADNERALDAS